MTEPRTKYFEERYEAALGRMLVRFNQLESLLAEIIRVTTKEKLMKPHLFKINEFYIQKVERLDLMLCAFPRWPAPDFERLRRINAWRNELAHGHFHQDPNTGEWLTESVHKKGHKSVEITPQMIDSWTAQVEQALTDVEGLLPYAWLDEPDPDRPLPPGASPVPLM
ncbi:hypothetical protein [Devosia sp. Leaf64]|uniref:hypothetical protein n=1 Tax=Devosia sp. Leaf64 TaxID=1736229 RepID=UPI000712AC2E|nr:hypothetical protein [Devosia sp. Leaf64]KQN75083.1 hypothetical protein ASE94_01830 [Devosia sp. Leaf64]